MKLQLEISKIFLWNKILQKRLLEHTIKFTWQIKYLSGNKKFDYFYK